MRLSRYCFILNSQSRGCHGMIETVVPFKPMFP